MRLHKFMVIGVAALCLAACGTTKDNNRVKITGTIENPIPQGEILLEKFETDGAVPVKTVHTDNDGYFEIELVIKEAGFYRLNVYGQQFETLILNQDDLEVEADGQGGNGIRVTGSRDMEHMAALDAYMMDYSDVVRDFNQRYIKAQNAGDEALLEELTEEGMALEAEKVKRLKTMAWNIEGSLVSLFITNFIQDKTGEFHFLDSLANKLQKEIPGSSHVQTFADNIAYFRPVVDMGEVAPEISLPSPDGNTLHLSDFRGKYVLLDFWAGWCGPCRKENPNVVAMYHKYNTKGFEVFSVSLDRTRSQWLSAIEEDGLVWPGHVSDLKYFQSAAAITYKVNAIPFALLLDPEGRVIGKNLRGRILQAKLASIFGE